jgi:hypothetical protein
MSPRAPLPQLVVRTHDPGRVRIAFALIALLWAFSLVVVWRLGAESSAPGYGDLRVLQQHSSAELDRTTGELDALKDRVVVLERSEQVSRAANESLQETLRQREGEIASLRADIAFFERLVGGGAPRQPLAINAFALRPIGDSRGYAYELTLTQNLKKAAVTSGGVDIAVDGVQRGVLRSLTLGDLTQRRQTVPIPFSFKYFQRLEGNLILPDKFTPNRIRLVVKSSTGEQATKSVAWSEALANGEKNDVRQ